MNTYLPDRTQFAPAKVGTITDMRGDVRELRDYAGAVFARYDYDAYGNITSSQVFATPMITLTQAQEISDAQPLRYAGYVWDAETGLYYCSQRYYDPATASFISRDPAKADGEKSPYLYCAGEPVGSSDPSGLWYRDNHYGLTYRAARAVGFSVAFSKAAANGSSYVDVGWDPLYSKNWYVHFNRASGVKLVEAKKVNGYDAWQRASFGPMKKDTRVNFYNSNFGAAKIFWRNGMRTEAARSLGFGLHAMQDTYAHGNLKPLAHQFPLQRGFFHNYWDNRNKKPWRYNSAYWKTVACMRDFSHFINKR